MENKEIIKFEQAMALDIRICTIIGCSRIPKKDRLLHLTINTGTEERQCVTNLGAQFEPIDLIDKSMPFILNLEPVTMAGILSTAMVIAVTDEEKKYTLLETFTKPGSIVL